MNLKSMASEYRKNLELLQSRIIKLEAQSKNLSHNKQQKIRKRIRILQSMSYESIQTIVHLENYYAKQ